MKLLIVEIAAAYVLDLVIGDPRWMPHPVKVIGWLAKKLEPVFRRIFNNERAAGLFFAITIVGTVWGLSFIVVRTAAGFSGLAGFAASVILIYFSLSVEDLKVQSMNVYAALEKGDLELARKNLGMIVGRDTQNLNEKEIVRATVETVAENIVDGILSPLFFAFIGGAPLAMAYKAVSTLDSTVGYKNERYINFGWASARSDDCANFIPARFSILFLPAAGVFLGLDGRRALRIALRDGKKNPSPNSGIPEAAVAGALGVRLGGLNFYNSVPAMKPVIGDDINQLDRRHIKDSARLAYVCSALFLVTGLIIIYAVRYV